jgi:transglutaminase-like putative cysteine protease
MQSHIITFHGTELLTAQDDSGKVYVAMKPIIEGMGLSWGNQSQKLVEDERYSVIRIPFATEGGVQEMLCLAADQLPAFLYSINPNKVRKDLREKIIAFQRETFAVINDYWNRKREARIEHIRNGYRSKLAQMKRRIKELEEYISHPPVCQTPERVMELIDKGLKYDELMKDYIELDAIVSGIAVNLEYAENLFGWARKAKRHMDAQNGGEAAVIEYRYKRE